MCSLAQALLKPQARSSHRLFAQPSTRMNLPKGYSQRPTRFPWASMKQQDEAQRGEHRALHEGRNTPAQSNKKKPLKQQWLFTAEQRHNTTKRVDTPLNSNTASNVYKTTLLFHSGLLKSSIPPPRYHSSRKRWANYKLPRQKLQELPQLQENTPPPHHVSEAGNRHTATPPASGDYGYKQPPADRNRTRELFMCLLHPERRKFIP